MDSLPHEIDGHVVHTNRSVAYVKRVKAPCDHVFVSGVQPRHSKEDFEKYFGFYGTVSKVCFSFILYTVYMH